MKFYLIPFLFLFSILNAQEDVFTLSPFEITSSDDSGYVSSSTLAGTRLRTEIVVSPITLRKKADSVTLQIILSNSSKKAIERNEQIMNTVEAIIEKAESTQGIRAHNGKISLSTRNKKVSIFSSKNELSHVTMYILGDLENDENVFDKTNQLKKFLDAITPEGNTVIEEGTIGLSIKNPAQYRAEIITLIIDDINSIKAQLGKAVHMNIFGLDGRVQIKQANESEIDLFIHFTFSMSHSYGNESSDD